jgi:hypothetical protein
MPFLTLMLRRARREYRVFRKLLGMVPRFEERLMECTDDEATGMAELVSIFNCLHTMVQLDFSFLF